MSNKDLLIISIVTFITAVVWIVTDAYHTMVKSTIPQPLRRAIAPLTPRLDTDVISSLKNRGQVVTAPTFKTVTQSAPASPTATIIPTISVAPVISVTPTIVISPSPSSTPTP